MGLKFWKRKPRWQREVEERKKYEKKMARLGYELARARRMEKEAERLAEIERRKARARQLKAKTGGTGILGSISKKLEKWEGPGNPFDWGPSYDPLGFGRPASRRRSSTRRRSKRRRSKKRRTRRYSEPMLQYPYYF